MKKFIIYIPVFLLFLLSSCEEVVDVDLEESEPRLVIEASILWFKGTPGNEQSIKLSVTSPFYEEELIPVENASVLIISGEGDLYEFNYQGEGRYINNNFEPELEQSYQLEIIYEEEEYSASGILMPVSPIDYIEQTESGGFSGEDIEVKAYYTDPADEENFYLFKFRDDDVNLEFYEDEFTNGNQIFGYYSNEDIARNDLIEIQIQGISKSYYEYLFILRSQVGSGDGGPFETMPAKVKGNIINQTNKDNYPFGYFRLSEADSTFYSVE